MIPYFLSAGVHLLRDLTAARDALRAAYPGVEFRLGPALGPHPLLEELVAARITQLDDDDSAPAFASSEDLTKLYAPMGHHDSHGTHAGAAALDTIRPKD
jgi:sirohydrochlorin ferrochelatase